MDNTISIIGIGRVGLPLSLAFAEAGFKVYGIDIDSAMIDTLKKGNLPFIEKDAQALLSKHISEKFFPTLDHKVIKESRYIILTLGTPVDEHLNPDYSQIDAILPIVAENLQKNQVVLLRSTIAPGTTDFIKSFLEKHTGMVCGRDFYLAFCPERIAEGKALEEIREIPQIIGGSDEKSSELAASLFRHITSKCFVTDSKSAELAKIFTNMYRYINFAIANEFSILAMEHGKNIYEIIDLVNRDYKRGGINLPGFTAGPCLFKDGFFLLNSIPFNELISVSWRINENFPLYLLNKIKEKSPLKGKKVSLLGLSFKKNIDDTRNSLSFKLKKALLREEADLVLHDPYVKKYSSRLEDALRDAEIIIIAVNHDEYAGLTKSYLSRYAKKACIICDVWNVTKEGKIIYSI